MAATEATRRPSWTAGDLVWVTALQMVVFLLMVALAAVVLGRRFSVWTNPAHDSLAIAIAATVFTGISFALVWHRIIRRRAESWREIGFLSAGWRPLVLALAAAVALLGVDLLLSLRRPVLVGPLPDPARSVIHPLRLALYLFGASVLTPLGEEMYFRGLLFRSLRSRLSAPAAILISSLAFVAVHPWYWLGWSVVWVFVVGLLCAWFVERTSSLLPGIVLHAGVNAGPVLIALVKTRLA
jgi:hypothetical protein